jgi:hypothetical protein
MKPEQVKKCNELLLQHQKETVTEKKRKIRDEAFGLIKDPMIRWIPAILSTKNIYIDPKEILSLSWDCFQFCMKHYKPHRTIPLPNHFYSYTRFYLASEYFKDSNKASDVKEQEKKFTDAPKEELEAIFHLEELKQFHSILPDHYKIIFEDALLSMTGPMKDRIRRKEGMPYSQYFESKKVFKIVIDYLLRR